MKKTPWYPGTIKPVRSGWYERDYAGIWPICSIKLDMFLYDSECGGYWYVAEPKGQLNDAWYEELPWRGIAK